MDRISTGYEVIAEVSDPETLRYLDREYLAQMLLAALGQLGYTVPGDTPDNLFQCGLCEARRIDGL